MPTRSSADYIHVYGGFTMRHTPCPDCGAPVAKADTDGHVCDREQWLDHQVSQQRGELDGLENEYQAFLDSPAGRFALWCAARHRRPLD